MITSLIHLVIYLIVVGVILWLLLYIVNSVPMFAPFQQVARVVITVIGLQFAGLADVGVPRFGKF